MFSRRLTTTSLTYCERPVDFQAAGFILHSRECPHYWAYIDMVAPSGQASLGFDNTSLRTPHSVELMGRLFKGERYNPRLQREAGADKWRDGIANACLSAPNILAVLLGDITLKPYDANLADMMAAGFDAKEAASLCTTAEREYKDLNMLGFLVLAGSKLPGLIGSFRGAGQQDNQRDLYSRRRA